MIQQRTEMVVENIVQRTLVTFKQRVHHTGIVLISEKINSQNQLYTNQTISFSVLQIYIFFDIEKLFFNESN